jgi:hypothetical protein
VTMRWAPAYTAMVEEDAGWRRALSRAWHLSGDNVLRIFAVSVAIAIITAILSSLFGAVFDTLLSAVAGPLDVDPLISTTIALAAASVVVAPAMPVFLAVLFFDLRARRDVATPPAAPAPPPGPYG